jgi:leader peptidase (prepilin peptidase)/N-methyltransferase
MSQRPQGILQVSSADLLTAGAFLSLYIAIAVAVQVVGSAGMPALVPSAILAGTLSLLSAVDLRSYRLPDALTLPLLAAGLIVSYLAHIEPVWWRPASAAIGFALLAAVAAVYHRLRNRPGLGLGDAKLLAVSGAWLGAELLPEVLLWASGAALICVLSAALRGGAPSAGDAIPFGPFLAFATWVLWLYGPA